jgi:hypothetical protein
LGRIAATLLVALGGFGAEVAAKLRARVRTRADERRPDLSILDVALAPEGELDEPRLDRLEADLVREVSAQLALSALVERPPEESSPPWLDVLLVGDLGEAAVRAAITPVIDRVERAVVRRFPNLLGHDAARVVVAPLLALGDPNAGPSGPHPRPFSGSAEKGDFAPSLDLPLSAKPERGPGGEAAKPERGPRGEAAKPERGPGGEVADVARALAARRSPKVRSFLFEAQTSRYILSREELVSTAVAMVELLVLAGLRDADQLAAFLRDDAPRSPSITPGPGAEPACFGTFGVASVHVDADLVAAYCRNRAALAVVGAMRKGLDLGLAEREELARALRTPWDEVRERLGLAAQSDAAFAQVEKLVLEEAPALPCPEIEPDDTPEDVRDRKFGDDWYRSVGGAIDDLIARLERRRMSELSAKIGSSGLGLARRRRQQVREAVDGWVWERPQGWAAARSALALLRDEAETAEAEAAHRIADLALPPMPTPEQLHRPVIALRGESERRPRPAHLWLTGAALAVPATLFGYQLLSLFRYPLRALEAPAWLIDAVSPPWGLIPAAVIAIATIAILLVTLVRRRHRELCEVRDDLQRSVEQLVTGREGSVLAYYLARLELARELWVLRLARIDRRLFADEVERLDEVQRALDTLWDQLRASQRGLGVRFLDDASTEEDLSQVAPAGDLILREAADGDLLRSTYAATASDEEELAAEFFRRLARARPEWRRELPMAEKARIDEFLDDALDLPGPGELLAGSDKVASAAALAAVERVLEDLSTRLSPSLGLNEEAIQGNAIWVIAAPGAAGPVIDGAFAALRARLAIDALGSEWIRLTSPRDDGRVYLAALVTNLPRAAIRSVS